MTVFVCLIIGVVVACMVVLPKLSALKTVRKATGASDYTVKDSMNLTDNNDIFLNTKVEKTPRNTQTTSQQR